MGFIVLRNLEALTYSVQDKERKQLPINMAEWSLTIMLQCINDAKTVEMLKEKMGNPVELTAIETNLGCHDWDQKMDNHSPPKRDV